MRERRNCVQVASSNLSLLEPTSYFICNDRTENFSFYLRQSRPLAPFQVLLALLRYDGICDELQLLHDLQAVSTHPRLRGVSNHIAIAAVSYFRNRVTTTLAITEPTVTMRLWQWAPADLYRYFCFSKLVESRRDSQTVFSGCLQFSHVNDVG